MPSDDSCTESVSFIGWGIKVKRGPDRDTSKLVCKFGSSHIGSVNNFGAVTVHCWVKSFWGVFLVVLLYVHLVCLSVLYLLR